MTVTPFRLLYDPPQTEPLPGPARARIAVGFLRREGDTIILSPGDCHSIGELESQIVSLKGDLDRVLSDARRKLDGR